MKAVSRIYMVLIFIFLYAPLLTMVLFSFNEANSLSVFTGFSLQWYRDLFQNEEVLEVLSNTLILAALSSVIATVIGTAAAVGIEKMRSRWLKSAVTTISNMPMMNPDIVTGISMALLFVFAMKLFGMDSIFGFPTVLIAHVTFNLPYVILSVTPKIRQMDRYLPEAALDLGCTPLQSFFKVELPAIMPGVLSGLLMAFTLSLDDFVISYFTTEGDFQTLPIYIFGMTKRTVTPDIYSLSTLLFVAVLLLLILSNVMQGHAERKEQRKIAAQAGARRKKKGVR
ncbi:MAG: ABC transporter permease [Clostridia bacterium]|nr:ABC transporter permease [Clostridia bacterium]